MCIHDRPDCLNARLMPGNIAGGDRLEPDNPDIIDECLVGATDEYDCCPVGCEYYEKGGG